MTALHVTFYSYKGGVGRTLALLNVAVVLAESGFKVVAIDLDLEAPGFGLSELTRRADPHALLGFSDLVIDRVSNYLERRVERFAYPILPERCGERLWLFPAGLRAQSLVRELPTFYGPVANLSGIFLDVLAEIVDEMEPDFVLIDSRTGAADIAAIPTTELSEVLVAVSGLSE